MSSILPITTNRYKETANPSGLAVFLSAWRQDDGGETMNALGMALTKNGMRIRGGQSMLLGGAIALSSSASTTTGALMVR